VPVSDTNPAANVDEELQARLDNGVLWLTLNRVKAGNAIPFYVRDRLIEHFRAANEDLAVRAIVLTAAGDRHFCTGADLALRPDPKPLPEGAPERPAGTAIQMMKVGFQQVMESMQDCEKPVICALNGTAAGGGAMLVLASDLVIASENAKLILVFVRRGLVPDGGAAYLLPRLVGLHKAKELAFFGDDVPAAEAERIGIVNKVVPADQLQAAAKEWAERLASGPTKSIGWTKRLLHDAWTHDRDAFMREEGTYVELVSHTEDSKEGVAAFMERRETDFKGW
jgi:2-(1,2-epoxy-1,2-dihydrophenyl)acetyl-CoA isomerase